MCDGETEMKERGGVLLPNLAAAEPAEVAGAAQAVVILTGTMCHCQCYRNAAVRGVGEQECGMSLDDGFQPQKAVDPAAFVEAKLVVVVP